MGDNDKLDAFRQDLNERQLRDHEMRIRTLETASIKMGVYALIGSVIGGAIVSVLAGRLLGG